MKRQTILLVFFLALAVLSTGVYLVSQKTSQPKPNTSPEKRVTQESTTNDTTPSSTNYIEYTKTALDNTAKQRRVLFFYASWCPTCQPAHASFRKNLTRIPQDVAIIRVHYNDPETDDDEKNLAKMYGITYQHTFVQIDSTGKEITKWNGGDIDELVSRLQ